jgi:hypothetical protein
MNCSAEELIRELAKAHEAVDKALSKAKVSMKRRWDASKQERAPYELGSLVFISAKHLPSTCESKKLDDKWQDPFKVVHHISESAYELELPTTWCGHPVKVKTVHDPILPRPSDPTPIT